MAFRGLVHIQGVIIVIVVVNFDHGAPACASKSRVTLIRGVTTRGNPIPDIGARSRPRALKTMRDEQTGSRLAPGNFAFTTIDAFVYRTTSRNSLLAAGTAALITTNVFAICATFSTPLLAASILATAIVSVRRRDSRCLVSPGKRSVWRKSTGSGSMRFRTSMDPARRVRRAEKAGSQNILDLDKAHRYSLTQCNCSPSRAGNRALDASIQTGTTLHSCPYRLG